MLCARVPQPLVTIIENTSSLIRLCAGILGAMGANHFAIIFTRHCTCLFIHSYVHQTACRTVWPLEQGEIIHKAACLKANSNILVGQAVAHIVLAQQDWCT